MKRNGYRQDDMLREMAVRTGDKNGVKTVQLAKIPPQSPALEEAVIGTLLVEKQAIQKIAPMLEPNDFYSETNGLVYAAILDLFSQGKSVDTLTVTTHLRKIAKGKAEWHTYLPGLTNRVASATNIEDHALIIREKAVRREMIAIAQNIERLSYSEETDALELLQNYQAQLLKISQKNSKNRSRPIAEIVREYFKRLELKIANPSDKTVTGLATGLTELDNILGGLEPGDLVIVAARPGMGKTSLVLCITHHVVMKIKRPVAFFSLEVNDVKLVASLVSIHTGIDNRDLKKGQVKDHDWHQLNQAQTALENSPLIIDDAPAVTYIDLRSRCLSLKTEHPDLALVVIDYLQLMSGVQKNQSRFDVVSEISRNLKLIAKEIGVPVIALSQLSRQVEQRGGTKRPLLSDLRESGSIEQDADKVVFVFRPEYYGVMQDDEGKPTAGIAELIVSKNRDGDTDTAVVIFEGRITKFRDLNYSESMETGKKPPF